ncbi:MAG: NIPSNAP family protein [Phycisphaerales bacterium]
MERREFLTKATVAGLASLGGGALMAQDPAARRPGESDVAHRTRLAQMRAARSAEMAANAEDVSVVKFIREYYELRRYEIETEEQKAGMDRFLSEAAIPALNRLGIKPVGVFYPNEGISLIYVLLVHIGMATFATLTERLREDPEFMEKGAAFINAPDSGPAYKNLEVQFMGAFDNIPRLERPVDGPGRIFQLRTYESPSEKAGPKKIEMFNAAEIAIFRKVGLHPVFFGQTLAGTKMPNLTYMLGFKDMDESKANWKAFGADPDWQKLRAIPEYADSAILRKGGITNLYLKPASYSQM